MAIYLDEQLDDEPLFGIVARYLEFDRTLAILPTILRLFGRTFQASCLSSGGLDHVARETEACWGLSPIQIAEKMTAFPYFVALSSPARAQLMLERMCGRLPAGAKCARIMALWPAGSHGYRYCQACLREDKLADGVTHWRRSHQLPGVVVCPLHGDVLWELDKQSITHHKGYVSPSTAIRLGVARIDVSLTRRQRRCCQRIAQVSADILSGSLPIDAVNISRNFRDLMYGASGYLCGARREDCMDRLLRQCFGDEYVEVHVTKRRAGFFDAMGVSFEGQYMRNVIALSLMRLVEEQPMILADWRFKDLYDYLPARDVRRVVPEVVGSYVPEVTCPSRFAQHGPRHLVPKIRRRLGELIAVCDCGMRFICTETSNGWELSRIVCWGADYENEVRRLSKVGMSFSSIAPRVGMPISTVFWHRVDRRPITNPRVVSMPITLRRPARRRPGT